MTQLHNVQKIVELQNLVDTLIDVGAGYDAMLSDGDEDVHEAVKPIVRLHAKHTDELRNAMAKKTIRPDTFGSVMGSVHKTVVAFRNIVGGLDKDTLGAVKAGEARVLSAYDKALDTELDDQDLRALLLRQRSALSDEINAMDTAA